jgi:hypothetical protein
MCVADRNRYYLYIDEADEPYFQVVELFPYENCIMQPIIQRISDGEYILITCSAQGFGIGIFISCNGDPVRGSTFDNLGTLHLPSIPLSLVYQEPYLLSLLFNCIQVHKIDTLELVQTIPMNSAPKHFKKTSYVTQINSSSDNLAAETQSSKFGVPQQIHVIFGSDTMIAGLYMVPNEFQIYRLFERSEIEDALNNSNLSNEMNVRVIPYL